MHVWTRLITDWRIFSKAPYECKFRTKYTKKILVSPHEYSEGLRSFKYTSKSVLRTCIAMHLFPYFGGRGNSWSLSNEFRYNILYISFCGTVINSLSTCLLRAKPSKYFDWSCIFSYFSRNVSSHVSSTLCILFTNTCIATKKILRSFATIFFTFYQLTILKHRGLCAIL